MAQKNTRRRLLLAMAGIIAFGLLGREAFLWVATAKAQAAKGGAAAVCLAVISAKNAYQKDTGRLPASFDEMVRSGTLEPRTAKTAAEELVYAGGREGVLCYQRTPTLAVKRGKPWGGKGPVCVFALVDDPQVQVMDDAAFRRKYAGIFADAPASAPAVATSSSPAE